MNRPRPSLSLFDSTCLIVGIIIGVGVYQMAPDIARGVRSPAGLFALWLAGGLLSLCGALCYAELATAYPQPGGDFVYLTRAYGRWAGFLFGWAQLAVVRPGDIVVLAFAFATYARTLWDPLADSAFPWMQQVYAITAILALTGINLLGVREGKWTQNLLTLVKAAGLLMVVAVAVWAGPAPARPPAGPVEEIPSSLALIFVLFTYGGWNEMAYVAAEVKRPERNIARALMLGTAAVILLYVLIIGAFLVALGFDGLRASRAVAADTVNRVWPAAGGRLIALLICLSALGAVNGLIFTGARISYAVGADRPGFRWLGEWHPRRGTPTHALALQGGLACALVVVLGSFFHAVLYTAAVVYSFYLATSLSVIVLRRREPAVTRPFRVPGYPLTPIVFATVCAFLVYQAVVYKPWVAGGAVALLLAGLPLHPWSARQRSGARHA
jgi:APA family basic amino acid/polyamine antiporter